MEDLSIKKGLVIPGGELDMAVSRSGGPGGQHANKTSTRVTLSWNVAETTVLSDTDKARVMVRLATHITSDGVLQLSSSESRSQHQNKEDVRERLAALLRAALERPKPRKKTAPSRAAKRRRVEEKKKRSETKKSRQKPDDD